MRHIPSSFLVQAASSIGDLLIGARGEIMAGLLGCEVECWETVKLASCT